MHLLTQEIRKKLPPLYATEESKDPLVICKFFLPMTQWTWYATEFDGEDRFFGYVEGSVHAELGYFSLRELENAQGPFRLPVERDRFFEPTLLSVVKQEVYATV